MNVVTVFPVVPEPCGGCDLGIAWLECYDGVFRCRSCVAVIAGRIVSEVDAARTVESGSGPMLPAPPAELLLFTDEVVDEKKK